MATHIFKKVKGQEGYEKWQSFCHCKQAVRIFAKSIQDFFNLEKALTKTVRVLPRLFSYKSPAGDLYVTVADDKPEDVTTLIDQIKKSVKRIQYQYCINTLPEPIRKPGVIQFKLTTPTPFAQDHTEVTARIVHGGISSVTITPYHLKYPVVGKELVLSFSGVTAENITDPKVLEIALAAVAKVQEIDARWKKERQELIADKEKQWKVAMEAKKTQPATYHMEIPTEITATVVGNSAPIATDDPPIEKFGKGRHQKRFQNREKYARK